MEQNLALLLTCTYCTRAEMHTQAATENDILPWEKEQRVFWSSKHEISLLRGRFLSEVHCYSIKCSQYKNFLDEEIVPLVSNN